MNLSKKAINAYNSAIKLYDARKNNADVLVAGYQGLAGAYRKLSIRDSLHFYYKKAIETRRALTGESGPLAPLLTDYGNFYSETGDYLPADSLYLYALAIEKKALTDKSQELAVTYHNLGFNQFRQNNYLKAIEWYKKSLYAYNYSDGGYFGTTNNPRLASEALYETAGNYYRLYLKNREASYAVEAQKYAQYYLNAMGYLEDQTRYLNSKSNIAEGAFDAYTIAVATAPNETEAFNFAECSKTLRLNEIMRENAAFLKSKVPDSLVQQLKYIQNKIDATEKKRQALRDAGKSDLDSVYLRMSRDLVDLNNNQDKQKRDLEKTYPEYYRVRLDRSIVSLEELQKQVLQPRQTLVEYFVGDTAIYAFVAKPEYFKSFEIKKDFPLDEWVKSFRTSLSADSFQLKSDVYADMAFRLYEKLVLPFKNQLSEDVVIVPDGVLNYLPFEALLTKKPEKAFRFQDHAYLLCDHNLSYSFSATLLREMKQKKHRVEPAKFIIAYAPFYDADTTGLAKTFADDVAMRRDLTPLHNSGEEAYRIAKSLGGEAITGKEATEQKFMETAPSARILHLATHGKADDHAGDYSYLAFAPRKDSLDKGLVYTRDLYNMALNADLVTLSACETGIGKLQRGEGVISLARAFAYAGAKSIVTSLWSVNDAKTKDLMLLFYKNLKKGQPKDAALRDAKLSFIAKNSPPNAHPFFWAGFIGVGDMAPIK